MEQQIVKRSQLTKLAFNPTFPVLLVADSKGHIYSLKLPDHLQSPGPGMSGDREASELFKALRIE